MFTLQYPAGESSGAIVLPNPILGDSLQVHDGKQINRARSGEINAIYNDWPQTKVRVYSFVAVTKLIMESFRTFLINTAGLEIGIVTHLNETLTGCITTPITEIVTAKDDCSYNLSFEFEESAS